MNSVSRKVEAAVAIIEISNTLVGENSREVLILRRISSKEDPWSGHYAFPGGRCEERDSSPFDTAIRETEEEAGVQLSREQLVQELLPTPAARGSMRPLLVQPFHFVLPERPTLKLNHAEMEIAHWLNIEMFLQSEGHIMREMVPGRLPGRKFPAWAIGNDFLWGFTYEQIQNVFTARGNSKAKDVV